MAKYTMEFDYVDGTSLSWPLPSCSPVEARGFGEKADKYLTTSAQTIRVCDRDGVLVWMSEVPKANAKFDAMLTQLLEAN